MLAALQKIYRGRGEGGVRLTVRSVPRHLEPWASHYGYQAWNFIRQGWPAASATVALSAYSATTLPDWVSGRTEMAELQLSGCQHITVLPDLSSLTLLRTLYLHDCRSLTTIPDLSSLTSLRTLDLRDCTSLTTLPVSIVGLSCLQRLYIAGCTGLSEASALDLDPTVEVFGRPAWWVDPLEGLTFDLPD